MDKFTPFLDLPPQIVASNATHLFVLLHFMNISDMALVDDRNSIVTADQAVMSLLNKAPIGMPLPFTVEVSEGVTLSPIILSTGPRRNNSTPTEAPTKAPCDNNITNRLKLTDGIVAGIAIGLFFAGFILALISVFVCFVCTKCFGRSGSLSVSSIKYKKHEEDLETMS